MDVKKEVNFIFFRRIERFRRLKYVGKCMIMDRILLVGRSESGVFVY